MNSFQSMNSSGILKTSYPDSTPLEDALRRKREKLKATRLGPDEDESDLDKMSAQDKLSSE